jgi:hypothetical protein
MLVVCSDFVQDEFSATALPWLWTRPGRAVLAGLVSSDFVSDALSMDSAQGLAFSTPNSNNLYTVPYSAVQPVQNTDKRRPPVRDEVPARCR